MHNLAKKLKEDSQFGFNKRAMMNKLLVGEVTPERANRIFLEAVVELEALPNIQIECVGEVVRIIYDGKYMYGFYDMFVIITVLGMIKEIVSGNPADMHDSLLEGLVSYVKENISNLGEVDIC